jgi:hypothetical protein
VVEDGMAEIRRVEYDVEETAAGVRGMGLAGDLTDTLIAILRTGKPWTGSGPGQAG